VALVVIVVGTVSGRSTGSAGGSVDVTGAPTVGSTPADGSGEALRLDPSPSPSVGPDVVVHVLGAVARAGVVTVRPGSRVSDAIERAGGAAQDADLARLNLARVVEDGERLYVPRAGEDEIPEALGPSLGGSAAGSGGAPAGAGSGGGASAGASSGGGDGSAGVVDLNAADQAALETLPGIGPALAGRILAWRDEHGRFSAVEDLLDVSGIGDATFEGLRDQVRV